MTGLLAVGSALLKTTQRVHDLPALELYVDEFGDRGFGAKSSAYFAMTGLIVPSEYAANMRVVASGLRNEIGTSKPLHWVEHFTPKPRHEARRQLAMEMIATLPGIQLVYVLAHKPSLVASNHMRSDGATFYNYTTKLLLERVAFAAKYWPGGERKVYARLGHVKGMTHTESVDQLEGAILHRRTAAPFANIVWPPQWFGQERWDGLQIADLCMGAFSTALRCTPGGRDDAQHLRTIAHLVRRGSGGQLFGYGIKVYGEETCLTGQHWWPTVFP